MHCHIAYMDRRAVFPLLESGDQCARGSAPSLDAALARLLALAQANLKDLGFAFRVRDKGIDCAMLSKAKQLKFRLKFELVSKDDSQLMDESGHSSSDCGDDTPMSASFIRLDSSADIPVFACSRKEEKEAMDSEDCAVQLPPRVRSRSFFAADSGQVETDGEQLWLVSAELVVGDPPQFDKVFRRFCAKCSMQGSARGSRCRCVEAALMCVCVCAGSAMKMLHGH